MGGLVERSPRLAVLVAVQPADLQAGRRRTMTNPLAGIRWLNTKNNSGEEMPAHACVVVSSSGDEGQFVITKPTTDSGHVWIAGPTPALDGDGATAVNDFPIDAL